MKTLTTPDHIVAILNLTPAQVIDTYSGSHGCACGCKGNWRFSSEHREAGTKRRGYAVSDDEVSDRSVATILRKAQAAVREGLEVDILSFGQHGFAVETSSRLYIVHTVEAL